ncbi:MAG: PKD domain-containing protein [Bacteroidota bacterium]
MKKSLLILILILALKTNINAQMRGIYTGPIFNNELVGMSFYSASEGYVAFEKWIGFTTDSGHTFIQKNITASNVDFGPYLPNWFLGFTPQGVHAFNKDTLIMYGHYGFVPSILYSTNQGNSFKLVFYSINNANDPGFGILNLKFPPAGNTGYAVDKDRILRSTDRGKTWATVFTQPNAGFTKIEFPVDGTLGYIVSTFYLWKTFNAGVSWSTSYSPPAAGYYGSAGISFVDNNKGWLSKSDIDYYQIYYTSNGGASWTKKNDPTNYEFSVDKFINDSTGFSIIGFEIAKTTDGGVIWERLPRDNSYEYLNYGFTDLSFIDENLFWAGGGDQAHIDITTNGGGVTLPNARFKIDVSLLSSSNTIKLNNFSKQGAAYSYKWIRNGIVIGTTYNTSYVSPRTFDTIQLVVTKGIYTDTTTQYVDARLPVIIPPCKANFTYTLDSSTLKCTATYNDIGWKHYWYFGDGMVDSTVVNPIHIYNLPGTFNIKHKIKNTITGCTDSSVTYISITRLQSCLVPDFTFSVDSFFENKVSLNGILAKQTEFSPSVEVTWNFGDGTPSPFDNRIPNILTHQFDSAKTYQVCFTVKNKATSCVSTICKPVTIILPNGCDATFSVEKLSPTQGNYQDTGIVFKGRPFAVTKGKRHTWIINNYQTYITGNKNEFKNSLKESTHPYEDLLMQCVTCTNLSWNQFKEVDVDSSNVKLVRHEVFDSSTNCTDSKTLSVAVNYSSAIRIIPTFNPEVPQLIRFDLYDGQNRIGGNFLCAGNYYLLGGCNYSNSPITKYHYYKFDGKVKLLLPNTVCGNGPSVYTKKVHVDFEPCAILSPHVRAVKDNVNPLKVKFIDSANISRFFSNPEPSIWYFGDGDSAKSPVFQNDSIPHTYSVAGNYIVTHKQKSVDNCYKQRSYWLTVGNVTPPNCPFIPQFYVSADAVQSGTIKFINYTTPDTNAISYKWYFGNGDSSTQKKPFYTYRATGSYTVRLEATYNGCTQYYDSTINVVYLPCPNPVQFPDTTITVICQNDLVNLNTLYNLESTPVQWNTGSPTQAGPGVYRMILNSGTPCRDTTFITIKQDVARWLGTVNSDWNNISNWNTGKIPGSTTHVIIEASAGSSCDLNMNVTVASLQIRPGAIFHIQNGITVNVLANCVPLPN